MSGSAHVRVNVVDVTFETSRCCGAAVGADI